MDNYFYSYHDMIPVSAFSAHTSFFFTNWACLENLQSCYLTFNNTVRALFYSYLFVYLSWFSSSFIIISWQISLMMFLREENCDGLRCLKVYKSCLYVTVVISIRCIYAYLSHLMCNLCLLIYVNLATLKCVK